MKRCGAESRKCRCLTMTPCVILNVNLIDPEIDELKNINFLTSKHGFTNIINHVQTVIALTQRSNALKTRLTQDTLDILALLTDEHDITKI